MKAFLGGAVAGLVAGALAAAVVLEERDAVAVGASEGAPRAERDAAPVDPRARERGGQPPVSMQPTPDRRAPEEPEAEPPEAGDPFGGLRGYAEGEIVRGWQELRVDEPSEAELDEGWSEYEALVRKRPRAIGRALAEKRTAEEVALDGLTPDNALAFLDAIEGRDLGPFPELVVEPAGLDAFFERRTEVKDVAGPEFTADAAAPLADGTRLVFPSGVYLLPSLFGGLRNAPRDVTVSGAGMDETLIVLNGAVSPRSSVENLRLEHCTIHTKGAPLLDCRRDGTTIVLDRVRVVGFDRSAGGVDALSMRSGVITAYSSVFAGGYGTMPARGELFGASRNAFLARFESCRFERLRLVLGGLRQRASVAFVACVFDDVFDDPREGAHRRDGVTVDGGSVNVYPGDPQELPARDLNDLFPGWHQTVRGW